MERSDEESVVWHVSRDCFCPGDRLSTPRWKPLALAIGFGSASFRAGSPWSCARWSSVSAPGVGTWESASLVLPCILSLGHRDVRKLLVTRGTRTW